MANITEKFWELFRSVSTKNDQSTPSGPGWYENNASGIIKYFKNSGPADPSVWTYMNPGSATVTETENAIAKSDRGKLENYFSNVIDQVSFNTIDYNRLRKYFIDLFATHRTLGTISTKVTDPHSLSNSDLDELFRSFGYPYSTQLRGFDENPLEQKIQFFLDLVNLYKVKGTPQSLVDVLQYYGVTEIDIYEFFLKLKDNPNNLTFEGKAVAGTTVSPGIIQIPYANLTTTDPHWLYTEQQILNLNKTIGINLPSKTPYLGIQPIVDLDGPEMSILVRNVQDQYAYYISTGLLPVKNAEVTLTGETVSLLELYLSCVYMFNKQFDVGHEADSYICYDGTNTNTVQIVAEYDSITQGEPRRCDLSDTTANLIYCPDSKLAEYHDLFSRLTPTNFLINKNTAGNILAIINPSLKAALDSVAIYDKLETLYSLLRDLSTWVRNNIGFGFINFGFILFGLNEFFKELKPVINFFKPYRARLVLLEALQIKSRLFNTIVVEDSMSVDSELQFHDILTADSQPCCSPDTPTDSTSIIYCDDGSYQTKCSRHFISGIPANQVWKGLWVDGDTYIINDVVPDLLENHYICIQSHVAGQATKPPSGIDSLLYWTLLSKIDCTSSLDIKTYYSRDTYDCNSFFDIGSVTDLPRELEIQVEQDHHDHLRCPDDGTGAVTSELISLEYDDTYSYNISNNVSSFVIHIPSTQQDLNYSIGGTIRNGTDVSCSIYDFIISSKTTTGFVVTLNGVTDSANYYFDWYIFNDDISDNHGIEPLSDGSTTVTVMLSQPFDSSSSYSISTVMVNTIDVPPCIYSYSIIEKTNTYFTIKFSAPIVGNNYTLEWHCATSPVTNNYQLSSGITTATIPLSSYGIDHDIFPLLVSFASNDSTSAQDIYDYVVTNKTETEFSIKFSSIINSDNYYISWIIPILNPGYSQMEYYQSGGFRNFDDEGSFDCTHGFDLLQISAENVLAYILLENDNYILQENGDRIKL